MTPCVIGHRNAFSTRVACASFSAISFSAAATAPDTSSSSPRSRWFAARRSVCAALGGAPAAVSRSRTARTRSSDETGSLEESNPESAQSAREPAGDVNPPPGSAGVTASASSGSRLAVNVGSGPPRPEPPPAPAPVSSGPSSETSRNVNTSDDSASRVSPPGPDSRRTRVSAAPLAGLVADTTLAYTYRSSCATPPDPAARDSAAAAAASPGEPKRQRFLLSRIAHVSPATRGRSGRAASNLASRGRTTAPGSPLALADAPSPCAVSTGTSESRDDESSSRTFPPNAVVVASIAAIGSSPADDAWTSATSAAVAVPSSPTPNADDTARASKGVARLPRAAGLSGGETYTVPSRASRKACVGAGEPSVTSKTPPSDSAARPIRSESTTRKLLDTSRSFSRSASRLGTAHPRVRSTAWRASARASRERAAANARASGHSAPPSLVHRARVIGTRASLGDWSGPTCSS
mmetsp:Transcript_11282/g.47161  ORF Transcript_11282/g.47161 Transcript_11282/m.47161 type:complete len:466 (+) Transcript_11282:388-1785(+)